MARKKPHEDHINHEAWAIPYGDLVTLLLAFFVVMYAVSSVNEGKYRVLSDSLAEAFGGPPRTMKPLQLGHYERRGSAADRAQMIAQKLPRAMLANNVLQERPKGSHVQLPIDPRAAAQEQELQRARARLDTIAVRIQEALQPLIDRDLVSVERHDVWLEVEIKADILFASGDATPREEAMATIVRLADILGTVPNNLRVEGYTDDQPIQTVRFPSNWELSAARAASVVHVFADRGVDEARVAIVGFGAQRPRVPNDTTEGRNANRRVVLVIMAAPDEAAPPAPPAPTTANTTTAAVAAPPLHAG